MHLDHPRGSFILEEENPKPFELGKSVYNLEEIVKSYLWDMGMALGRAVETCKRYLGKR